jgi:hypothetical protein
MDRDFDAIERTDSERTPSNEIARQDARVAPQTPPLSREPEAMQIRSYTYQISPAERETLREIGRFRVIPLTDLARHRYLGDASQMRDDLRSLRAQGLLQSRRVWINGKGQQLEVLVLSKRGKEVLANAFPNSAQSYYSGFVKPGEVAHDSAIYRMYQAEREKIESLGGQVRRVVLDYELKKNVYSPMAKAASLAPREYARRQAEVAAENRLKVIRGKILLPDLRIEYVTRDGISTQVDLELATHHYRGSQMRDKASAGFKMYAPQESAAQLTRAFDPELTESIFSFS